MSEIFSHEEYARNPSLAVSELGMRLKSSTLCLFLGAGVSAGFNLPSWKLLIARVLGKETDADFVAALENKSVQDLRRLIDPIDDQSLEYYTIVHDALYREVKPNLLEQLRLSPLLLAIAAMMTGAHRGRIDSVVTYNYDDLLEQYLRMLGLGVCQRVLPDELSTRSDVELNYVHGKLPQSWSRTEAKPEVFVLSDRSYIARSAQIDFGWPAWVEHKLYSKLGLFLGLSGDDDVILVTLKRVKDAVKRRENYLGYWILTPDAFEHNKSRIVDAGICPIPLNKEAIPDFIFRICQHAAI